MNVSDYIKPAILDDFWQIWTLEDVKRRCQFVRVAGSPVETLVVDGVPLLEIHPLEFSEPERKGDSYVVTVTQNVRRLPSSRGESL